MPKATRQRRIRGEGSIYQIEDGRWKAATYAHHEDGNAQGRAVTAEATGLGTGIRASSDLGTGVYGLSLGSTKPAIFGRCATNLNTANSAIYGLVGPLTGKYPAAPERTGVYGRSDFDGDGSGVHGYCRQGRAVFGETLSGSAVVGQAGTGIAGHFTTPVSGASGLHTGYALRATGRIRFDQCAGVATILATKSSVVVTPGIDLASTSAVVATLQASAGGATTVHRCVVNMTTNTFTIHLTKAATQNVKVAWHVFG